MKNRFVRMWDHADSPVLWVEMLYRGDTERMKRYIGFSYGGHYFLSRSQVTTFYRNLSSEAAARRFGALRYGRMAFIRYFCSQSRAVERQLLHITASLTPRYLHSATNPQLIAKFRRFFSAFASLYAFYRFSRPEFYESVLHRTQDGYARLKRVGLRRLQMHQAWMVAFQRANPFFVEVGRRIGRSPLEVKNFTSQEIIDALTGRSIPLTARTRISRFGFYYRQHGFDLTTNIPKIESVKSVKIVKGQPAYAGRVIGRALVVVESLTGIYRRRRQPIAKNSILITVMTSPEMVHLMKKVSAFVTDEGGMLCHAAVIAREMRKPCVIGTKFATHVFKTGDIIEVDAFTGLIKRISR